jgi:hypothetical protein
MYDTRIGRFPSVDPLAAKYPFYTPYSFAGNKPIWAVDLDGLEEYYTSQGQLLGKYGTSTEIRVVYDSQVQAATSLLADPSAPGAEVANSLLYNRGSAGAFSNPNEAAIDWAARTNGRSIADNREYHSFIFSTRINGKRVTTYTEPIKQEINTSKGYFAFSENTRLVADIHSHGHWSGNDERVFDDDQISPVDREEGEALRMSRYIAFPNGNLDRYNSGLGTITGVSSEIPRDPNDPESCPLDIAPVIDRSAPTIPNQQ